MRPFDGGGAGRGQDSRERSSQAERQPVDVLAERMAMAKLARISGDWAAYANARDAAVRLVLGHRVEDEISRFRQVVTACTGSQEWGEAARGRIQKALSDAFTKGINRRESPHDVIVGMQRIPRIQATRELISALRREDGKICIGLLLSEDGRLANDIQAAFGDDPAKIAAMFTDRDWADFARPLMALSPGELRQDVMVKARSSLRRTLSSIASVSRCATFTGNGT